MLQIALCDDNKSSISLFFQYKFTTKTMFHAEKSMIHAVDVF